MAIDVAIGYLHTCIRPVSLMLCNLALMFLELVCLLWILPISAWSEHESIYRDEARIVNFYTSCIVFL